MKKGLISLIIFLSFILVYANKIDKSIYMPEKLIYSELSKDYPIEIEELFKFYYDIINSISSYDLEPIKLHQDFYHKKLKDTILEVPIKKKLRLKYLIWLSQNKIPLYFREYIAINGKFHNLPNSKILLKSIIPMKFWDEVLKDISIFSPTVMYINNLLTESIKETYPNKLNFLDDTIGLFIKGEVIDLVYAERAPKNNHFSFWPVQYVKIKVKDSIGNEFNEKEINLVVLSRPFLSQRESRINIDLLNKGDEYLIPIRVSYSESSFTDEFFINEERVNDHLKMSVSEIALLKLVNDNYQVSSVLYPKFNLKNGNNYLDLKKIIENEISFLKSGYK